MSDPTPRSARWFAELRRRKVVRVAVVYVLIAWVLIQVADATFQPIGLPAWANRMLIVFALLGFPLACGLAWAFDVTPRGIERTASPTSGAPAAAPGPGAAARLAPRPTSLLPAAPQGERRRRCGPRSRSCRSPT